MTFKIGGQKIVFEMKIPKYNLLYFKFGDGKCSF
jgi:hypothetical protein